MKNTNWKRKICEGRISIYDYSMVFVTSRKYKSNLERRRIINHWMSMYNLKNRLCYFIVSPETFNYDE